MQITRSLFANAASDYSLILETSVEREKAVQVIDMDKEVKKYEITLFVNSILALLRFDE